MNRKGGGRGELAVRLIVPPPKRSRKRSRNETFRETKRFVSRNETFRFVSFREGVFFRPLQYTRRNVLFRFVSAAPKRRKSDRKVRFGDHTKRNVSFRFVRGCEIAGIGTQHKTKRFAKRNVSFRETKRVRNASEGHFDSQTIIFVVFGDSVQSRATELAGRAGPTGEG